MLNVKNIGLTIDNKTILSDISFTLEKGDTLSIIGPSGCGKSTLLLCLSDIHKYDKGEIDSSFEKKALILQQNALFPWKTVRENINLALINENLSTTQKNSIVDNISKELKINHILDSYPNEISGGEKQRAAVCRSLVTTADLLLMDEPSSALDLINKDNFQNLLINLQLQYNLTYIIVTHSIEEAVFMGKKIAVMDKGKIKKIIHNDCFGNSEIRDTYEYFSKCKEIKHILENVENL